jgi:hypothetical protein
MAAQAQSWGPEPRERAFDMPSLRRLAIWGGLATAALLVAVIAGYTDAGARRLASVNAQKTAGTAPQAQFHFPELEAQMQRLAGAVDGLAIDRERLVARIGAIERNLEDITGALKRQAIGAAPAAATPATPPAPAGPSPSLSLPAAAPAPAAVRETAKEPPPAPEPPATTTVRAPGPPLALLPTPTPAPERLANAPAVMAADTPTDPARTDFGVDVGGAVNFDGLRALWGTTKGNNAALLEGLYPLVVVRENSRTKGAELRLIVGPLGNVEAAARLCAALSAARRYCQPVGFEGQRLAEADSVPEPKPAAAPKPRPAAPPPPVSNVPRLFR